MDHPEGAGSDRGHRVDFDRRVRLEFRGAQISSDGGLLVMRELDDALGLSDLASEALSDNRTGKNTVHRLDGLFRQSVFGRLAGYEDVNDADRLALDPVMRQVVGGRAVDTQAASASQMGRFETETLALPENRAALADLNGTWIDRFHDRNGLKYIVLDMDSSVSPTHGDQEGTAWNGHFDCTCYHPNFLFTEINHLAGFCAAYEPVKRGRRIVGVRLAWGLKAPADLVKAQRELDRPRVGRTARRAGLVETIADERYRLAESLANAPGLVWTSEPDQKPPKPMGEP